MSNVLVIGDQHRPFEHPLYLKFCQDTYKRFGCNKVVNIGDEWDQCALSRYDSDPDGMSAGEEQLAAVEASKPWYKAFPEMTLVESNHGLRIFKKAFSAGIPRIYMKAYRDFQEAPVGWVWKPNVIIDKVLYFHGEPFAGIHGHVNAAAKHRMSVVIGHIHCHAGVQYSRALRSEIFGMNVGCGIDDTTYPFRYAQENASKPVLGCGVVLGGKEAIFVPMR